MIGVRLPSRIVLKDILRGLLFVAAVMAVGVGYRGHGLQGAAKSRSDSKFVDPFLDEDVAAPGDDEIPRIPEATSIPEADSPAEPKKRRSASEISSDPPLNMDPESESEANSKDTSPKVTGPKKEPDAKEPVSVPGKAPRKPASRVPVKMPIRSGTKPDIDPLSGSVPGSEPSASDDPEGLDDPQSMPKVQSPRLPRQIKKTATPKLDADHDLMSEGDLSLPDADKNQPKLRALRNEPTLGKPAWKSTAGEPAASPGSGDSAKAAADGPPAESARFERSGNIEDLNGPIDKIIIEGNKTIKTEEIKKLIKTREGRVADSKQIREDVRTLVAKRWFFDVEPRIAQSKDGTGNVLVFRVNERPMVKKITFIGNKKIKEKALNEVISMNGLKVNGGYDVGANREAVHRILSLYQEKGYQHVTVELEKGDSPEDREVVFKIDEGPKVVINKISFVGNSYFSTAVLKTQIKTKKVILWFFGGKFDRSSVDEDVHLLGQYYRDLGFFDVQIRPKVSESADKSKIHVEYIIEEGVRFKVRNIEFVGNRVIPEEKLRKDLKVKPSDFYAMRFVKKDQDKIVAQYGELGRIFCKVEPRTRSFEEPGYVDLVYDINEDRPYRIGRIHVHINGDHPHTKESAVLTKLTFKPGELASMAKIEKSKQRLKGCGLFAGGAPGQANAQQGAAPPEIRLQPSELPTQQRGFNVARGQDDGAESPGNVRPKASEPSRQVAAVSRGQNPANGGQFDNLPFSDSQDGPPPDTMFSDDPEGYIDPIINVFETSTGRINMGIGVNSNAGLLGNITLEENNFDITKFPTSTQDVIDGTAFRGGGQQFRVEAVPGLQLSRYSISWRDPYFMNQNVMLGVSGQYYNRYYYNWTELREGGRVTLGHQFNPNLSGSITARAEMVRITNPSDPIPPDYLPVLGDNFLSTVLANVTHDTRDSPMLPGSGHYVQATFEEGIANFVYQKYDVEARQHFLVRERPDGGSRHVISVIGNVGWIGTEAPFFERFFAGGFGLSTFRGFQYQGVGPRYQGVRVGGEFQALGTVEYLIPITADNTVQMVTFTDFGTVDSTATFSAYRQSVGAGLRLTVPMLGPVPIAIDFAVPIARQSFDSTQVISFNMSGGR
jgi:outer membrane protein insertion porin family